MKRMYYAAAAVLPAVGVAALPAAQATAATTSHKPAPAARAKTVSLHQAGVRPRAAFGCNGDVCIGVNGEGLYVSTVFESIYLKGKHCGKWYLTYNGRRANSTTMCVEGHASLSWLVFASLANNTKVCVSAAGIPGKPCETVHN
jgi:hypothetical protein